MNQGLIQVSACDLAVQVGVKLESAVGIFRERLNTLDGVALNGFVPAEVLKLQKAFDALNGRVLALEREVGALRRARAAEYDARVPERTSLPSQVADAEFREVEKGT